MSQKVRKEIWEKKEVGKNGVGWKLKGGEKSEGAKKMSDESRCREKKNLGRKETHQRNRE